MTLAGNWKYPTSVRFGRAGIRELADACQASGIERPLLVTDPGLSALPMIANAAAHCRSAGLGIETFDKVQANPIARNVEDGLAAYRAGGHRRRHRVRGRLRVGRRQGDRLHGRTEAADVGLRGRGGLVDPRRSRWHCSDRRRAHDVRAEVGRAGVITDESTHTKKIIFHPRMMPKIAILDPELTIGLPPAAHRWRGNGCAFALSRSLLRPWLPSARRRRRGRRHAAGQGLSAARGEDRRRHRGARDADGRRRDGRDGVPEGPGRDPLALASRRFAARVPPRHDQRRIHALRAAFNRTRSSRGSSVWRPVSGCGPPVRGLHRVGAALRPSSACRTRCVRSASPTLDFRPTLAAMAVTTRPPAAIRSSSPRNCCVGYSTGRRAANSCRPAGRNRRPGPPRRRNGRRQPALADAIAVGYGSSAARSGAMAKGRLCLVARSPPARRAARRRARRAAGDCSTRTRRRRRAWTARRRSISRASGAQKLWAGTVTSTPTRRPARITTATRERHLRRQGPGADALGRAARVRRRGRPGRLHLRPAVRAPPGDQREPRRAVGVRARRSRTARRSS